MVPDRIRNLNASVYTPQSTSIGPLHKEDEHLKVMEEHKVGYMYQLFRRTVEATTMDMEQITRNCTEEVLALVTQARACYAPSLTEYDDYYFAEIMVIDGCFILELLYKFKLGFEESDPIFDNILLVHEIKIDLLLLEKQIPFFVLNILFGLTVKQILKSADLPDLVLYFFKEMNIINDCELNITPGEHCHILGLIQSCYQPIPKRHGEIPNISYSATEIDRATRHGEIPNISYSATEIDRAGVKFKAQRDKNSLLAVEFEQSYVVQWLLKLFVRETCFKIPVLCIKNSTPTLLRNLIAYEQCCRLSRHYVTSFAFLMDRLIETKDDVSLLVRSNVIHHNLGTSEDVTNLFNDISNGVVLRDFYYTEEWRKLDEYCNQFWPKILISLTRLYRSTTWKTLTVISALIIFGLTLVQTIFAVTSNSK